jgi:hypothetical protein
MLAEGATGRIACRYNAAATNSFDGKQITVDPHRGICAGAEDVCRLAQTGWIARLIERASERIGLRHRGRRAQEQSGRWDPRHRVAEDHRMSLSLADYLSK